jgi:hypothetical protein
LLLLNLFRNNVKKQFKEDKKQNTWKKKQRMKEKRVTKQKQSKRKFAKKMRQTRAQIKGDKLEKSAMKQKVKGTLLPVSH